MSITVNDRTVGIWYVTIPNGDWMAGIQALEGGRFRMDYRFRYYRDEKAFDSDDKKNWYSGIGDDYGSAVDAMRTAARTLKEMGKGESWEVLKGNRTLQDFMSEYLKLPFVHAKRAFEKKHFPDAPPAPTDEQRYVDPKTRLSLRWDASMDLWVDDAPLDPAAGGLP